MERTVECPLDGDSMMPAAVERHVRHRHPHLMHEEKLRLIEFLTRGR